MKNPIDIFRLFLFVREAKEQNTGLRVEGIQRWCGGQRGQSWCCYLATMVLDIAFQGNSPIPRLGAVQDVYDLAKQKKGCRILLPNEVAQPGDLFLYVNEADHAHHIGMITQIGGAVGIAGNTSEDGASSNGKGCYEHGISTNRARVKYVRYT
jgi:hypothetical protein